MHFQECFVRVSFNMFLFVTIFLRSSGWICHTNSFGEFYTCIDLIQDSFIYKKGSQIRAQYTLLFNYNTFNANQINMT